MDVDPSWSFDDYQAYERARLHESLAEQARAQADGLEVDPKSEPHGGYRIACVWPAQVTSAASALSAGWPVCCQGPPPTRIKPTLAEHLGSGADPMVCPRGRG
jgi:hypothetical protein